MLTRFGESQKARSEKKVNAAVEQLLPSNANASLDNERYDYSSPLGPHDLDTDITFIRAVAKTAPFRRLNDVRFLGALDYCLVEHPNGQQGNARFTRAQHSTGVAILARHYVSSTGHSQQMRLACIAAAMLHDVGHCPFSHTLEPIFKDRFDLDHHNVTERLILGSEFSDDIPRVLMEFGIEPQLIVDILNGQDQEFDGFFSGPINFDTIEGILRSRNYLKMQDLGISPVKVVVAATSRLNSRDMSIVDAFWASKDEMYNVVIRSRLGVFFDALFLAAAQQDAELFKREDFYIGETQAFRKFPTVRRAARRSEWRKLAQELLPETVPFVVRRFMIDPAGDFFEREDRKRYRQEKRNSSLTLREVLPA